MKTIAILFTALSLTFAPVAANAQLTSSNSAPLISQKIQDNLHVPDQMKNSTATEPVRVVFTIDEKGHAHVVDIASRRPDLHASVISQLESIDFTGTNCDHSQTYSIWLNFKVV